MTRLLLIMLLALLSGCTKPKPPLNVFVWSEYIDPAVVADFENQFDCRVVLDYYEDPESMMAKLAAGGDSLYDVVFPSNNLLPALIKRGFLARLSRDPIPNLANIDPGFTNTVFDPGNVYGAPYQWGTTGLYIRPPKARPVKESWSLLFDPVSAPGNLLLLEDPRSCIGAALKYRGRSLNTADPRELAEAGDLLTQTKQHSLGFEGSVGGRNRVLSKGATIAIVYSIEGVRGMEEDTETKYFIPLEGSEIWLDCVSILAKAPHPDLAGKFINYLLDPQIAARCAEYNRAGTPNRAAREFIKPSLLKNPAVYPPPEVMQRLEYAHDLGEQNRLYEETWTQIKAR